MATSINWQFQSTEKPTLDDVRSQLEAMINESPEFDEVTYWAAILKGIIRPRDFTLETWESIQTIAIYRYPDEITASYTIGLAAALCVQVNTSQLLKQCYHLASQLRCPQNPDRLLLCPEAPPKSDLPTDKFLPIYEKNPTIIPQDLRRFLFGIQQLTVRQLAILGPVLAAIILMLSRRDAPPVLRKLRTIPRRFASFYLTEYIHVPMYPDRKDVLSKYTGWQMNYLQNNTLFKKAVEVAYDQETTMQAKELLQFLWLQNLEYTGLHLVKAIDIACETFAVTPDQLYEHMNFNASKDSWRRYLKFLESTTDPATAVNFTTKYWTYIRVFEDAVLYNLTLQANSWLCTALYYMVDYKNGNERLVQGLVARRGKPDLDISHKAKLRSVSEELSRKFGQPGPSSSLVDRLRNLSTSP